MNGKSQNALTRWILTLPHEKRKVVEQRAKEFLYKVLGCRPVVEKLGSICPQAKTMQAAVKQFVEATGAAYPMPYAGITLNATMMEDHVKEYFAHLQKVALKEQELKHPCEDPNEAPFSFMSR